MAECFTRRTRLVLIALALTGGCALVPGTETDDPVPTHDAIGREAVTYQGDIPCADCPAQRMAVTLFPDGTFRLRRTYVEAKDGKDESFYDRGRWARSQDDGDRLRLASGTEGSRQFAIVGTHTLRALDNEGHEIRSALVYDLKRRVAVDPVAGPMRLRGMYARLADAATFNECLTGKRYPVSPDQDHASLEHAYLAARRSAGELMAVTVDGRFVERAAEAGAAAQEHVVVERFARIWPGETCAPQSLTRASLLETYWRPVEVEGKAVLIHAGTREPHFVLFGKDNRVRGYTGCNSLTGTFEQGADVFRFKILATTRMACPPAIDFEARFLSALHATMSYRSVGESLELRDKGGRIRMRLEARNPK